MSSSMTCSLAQMSRDSDRRVVDREDRKRAGKK